LGGVGSLAMPLPKTSKNVFWQKKSGQLCRFFPSHSGNRKKKKPDYYFGLKTAIFQILKTVQGQDQDRFGQDLKNNGLKTKTGLKDYITGVNCDFYVNTLISQSLKVG